MAPSPIVVAPSQNWAGNDGPWSSFEIQVGTPAQNLQVFISTSVYQTLVVAPEGCISFDPSNCAVLRGGEFYLNASSTWSTNTANLSSNIYPLLVDTQLGYNGRAELGFDVVTLGWKGSGGPTLQNQTVGGFAAKDTYLGLFGISPRASNFTTFDNPIPSYVQNLRNQSLIPSISWAYTAGNQYRLDQVLGSLVLGGYDKSKLVENDVTWTFNSEDSQDLTVQIESIIVSDSTKNTSLLPSPIPSFLDSSLPYIWLPVEACKLFEKAFNLVWDNVTELYLVNDTQHDILQAQNASLTFTLGNLTAGVSVNITLPYAAFDLTASSPLVTNTSRYFPLKRAANDSQYVLGRTFFQEAYVIADYERGNFSVSQCNWDAEASQEIVPIYPPGANGSLTAFPKESSSSKHNSLIVDLPAGVGAGIIVTMLVLLAIHYGRTKKLQRLEEHTTRDETRSPPIGLEYRGLKPELHAEEILRPQELEAEKSQWVVEADGHERQIFELSAREEPFAELEEARN
ncbi:acid protease [Mollisia scopiformis]|uniref:Acid protease n=1 Tax=Mollisia scopiformis TaxID=149040 RepID=A0A132BBP4_MOLSC|nr:acid protease [Mollisia scopiformis]KUJ09801.1 acid protease [Mollisia scopiformis]